MKKLGMLIAIAVVAGMAVSCKKVEDVAPEDHPMLPLRESNRWVYVDSFFTTSSLPSSDTLVTAVEYRVTRRKETQTGNLRENGERQGIRRYEAWDIQCSQIPSSRITCLVKGDTIYSSPFYFQLLETTFENCNQVERSYDYNVDVMQVQTGSLVASMTTPLGDGAPVAIVPMFMDLPDCIEGLGPDGYEGLSYRIFLDPPAPSPTPVTVVTPAGTFTCTDFGAQKWSAGNGMIESYFEGSAAFYDDNHQLQTSQLRWKRTLLSLVIME